MTTCKLCQEFYEKYPLQKTDDDPYNKWVHVIEEEYVGKNQRIEISPVKCAFPEGAKQSVQDNVFDSNNWNCLTIEKLRELSDYTDRNTDASIGVIRIQEGHIVMLWYKHRGRVSNAYIMCEDEEPKILTYDIAATIIQSELNNEI